LQLLTNPLYTGKVRNKSEVHPGEHEAIVDEVVWQRVQAIMASNSSNGA
jgi:site-specific DNA recombinase